MFTYAPLAARVRVAALVWLGLPLVIAILRAEVLERWFVALVPTLVILFGVLLFRLRERYQFHYGVLDIAFAALSSWIAASRLYKSPTKFQAWLGIGTGLYIMVRGCDNVSKGFLSFLYRILVGIGVYPSETNPKEFEMTPELRQKLVHLAAAVSRTAQKSDSKGEV